MPPETLHILLVEDNDADILLAQLAFDEIGVPHQLHITTSGQDALDFLQATGPFAGVPRPHLILLDLNMPRMSGLEVLLDVKAHPSWRNIPVIVLTTSRSEQDRWQSYNRYANAYISKQPTLAAFVESIRGLSLFWSTVATLSPDTPPEPRN